MKIISTGQKIPWITTEEKIQFLYNLIIKWGNSSDLVILGRINRCGYILLTVESTSPSSSTYFRKTGSRKKEVKFLKWGLGTALWRKFQGKSVCSSGSQETGGSYHGIQELIHLAPYYSSSLRRGRVRIKPLS